MLLEQIKEDLKEAQLSRDEIKVSTIRMLLSEITYAKIAKGQELTDSDIIGVVQKEIKKRQEASLAFRQGNREDQATKEESEAKVLNIYLPAQLTDTEIETIVSKNITEIGAQGISDFGKVMGKVMNEVGQKAAGQRVSDMIKKKLAV